MNKPSIRQATADDTHVLALLLNGTQEPHFHTTAAQLAASIQREPERYLVAERNGHLMAGISLGFPEFHPQHVWLGFSLHPDHRTPELAQTPLAQAAPAARAKGRQLAWTSVRADCLSAQPDLNALGFREVHRTFGGGFFLDAPPAGIEALETRLQQQDISIQPALTLRDDPRLKELYSAVRGEKVTAEPTILAANEALHDPDSLWEAAFVAIRSGQVPGSSGEVLGLALPERSRLDAWNAVLLVCPEVRRRSIGTALQARVCATLHTQGFGFLNTAGVDTDAAYLGVLRRLSANIEPDGIAFEAALP